MADHLVSILGLPGRDDREVAGHVRIAAFTTAIRHGALSAVADAQHEHERLTCSLAEMDPTEAHHALLAGTVDVAVTHHWRGQSPPTHPALVTSDVAEDVADIICHRDSPLAERPTFADLADHCWVTTGSGTICNAWLMQMMAEHGVRPRVTTEISDFALHLTFVAAGLGLALVPRLGRPELAEQIRSVELPNPPARIVHVAIRRGQENDPAIGAVSRALESRLRRQRSSS